MFSRIIPFVLALSAALSAQSCPDMVVRRQPLQQTIGPVLNCSSIQYRWRNIQIGNGVVGCPMFVVIRPEHDAPASQPGSGTYVRPAGRSAITQLVFSCDISYLLFIPISSSCNLMSDRIVGHLINYEMLPCSLLPAVEPGTVQGS